MTSIFERPFCNAGISNATGPASSLQNGKAVQRGLFRRPPEPMPDSHRPRGDLKSHALVPVIF